MVIQYITIALMGALASVLSNTGVAVFNDGFRPILPEYLEGRMDRKALAATSFAISFGLVIGFGIPVSLTSTIILIHSILLGTDIIGTFCGKGKKGMIIAGGLGALYGVGLVAGLQFIVDLFSKLPINFLGSLGQVSTPITIAFAIFPAVAVALEYGLKKGILTAGVTLLIRQIVTVFGSFPMGEYTISLNKDGMALLAGMVFLVVYAVRDKEGAGTTNEQLVAVFSEKVSRIRKNIPYLAVMGGLVACATSLSIVAGDPISLGLAANGELGNAAMTALARAIGFIPLIATTAITTGVYGPVGMTFVFVIGFLVRNPIIALILGAGIIVLEVLLLTYIAKLLDKFPGVRKCGDNIRTAMSRVLEIALLIGGMMAAQAIAPGFGLFVIIGMYLLNKFAKKPIVELAIGPIGAIAVGILVNILHIIGLYPV
ncbi:YhfT family protein [Parasphaerochaeta coccoides]|uniref:Transport system permease protein n=1 Tax=Parasphaerochaeta coccoides (strain ATCC BAA-1237 / DSM 17374 / SPN1) TaxID=760011 RepID=F4GIV0_PARC1|nr:YhfT family protein [Parasphaerochaeta coccoides]AEC02718.1 Protein of unknown function, YhfT [Parasphaerochaeta coccoides DSM 17374]